MRFRWAQKGMKMVFILSCMLEFPAQKVMAIVPEHLLTHPLIETMVGTYLLPGQGEILGQFRLPGDATLDGTSPVRVFGRYKKFKKGSLEVIQVIWTQIGKEVNNKLKKETIKSRIASVIPYKGSFLEKSTALALKGDEKEFIHQVRQFIKTDEMLPKSLNQEGQKTIGAEKDQNSSSSISPEKSGSKKDDFKKPSDSKSQAMRDGGALGLYALNPLEQEKTKEPEYRFVTTSISPPTAPITSVSEGSVTHEGDGIPVIHSGWEIRGCVPKIDFVRGWVSIQKRKITFENGQEIEEGPCEISEENYPIKYEYRECPDLIDREDGKAFRQYTRFWVDGTGQIMALDQVCQKDEEQSFIMREEPEGCGFLPDFDGMKAQIQTSLVYRNPQGTRIVVEPCRPKPDAPLLDIQKEFKGWRHDFELGFSYKQHRFTLEQDGVLHYLSPQLEDSLAYPHEKTTQTCSLFQDPITGESFVQERLYLETPEGPVWISECRVGERLMESEEGCEGLFEHNFETHSSCSYTRKYYEKDGQRIYMTPCQVSTQIYPHSKRIVDYLHKDEEKNSYPKLQTVLSPQRGDEIIIRTIQSQNPRAAVAYVLESTFKKPMTEEETFEGCFKLTPLSTIQRYIRGDGSFYEEMGPERTIKKSRNLCIKQEETRTRSFSSWGLWDMGRNIPIPVQTPLDPHGSTEGTLTCASLFAQHVPHKFPNMFIKLVHTQSVEKRLNRKYPGGQIQSGAWTHVSGPHQVRTEICRL